MNCLRAKTPPERVRSVGSFFIKTMGLFDSFKTKKEFTPGIGGIRDLFGGRFFGGASDNIDLYKGWTYRAISIIAEGVSDSRLRLYKRGKNGTNDEEIFDHELLSLLENPNPEMSGSDLLEWISSFLDLEGDSFLYKSKVGMKTTELWPLRSDWVKVTPSTDKVRLIGGYSYYNGDKTITLDIDEVIAFREFNPRFIDKKDALRGYSTLKATKELIEEDNTIKAWNKKFFENGATPNGVLEYDGELNDKQKRRIELGWKKQQEGQDNVGKTAILSGGLRYKQTQLSQRELAFIEQRKLDRDDIFLMFGVPKGLLMAEDVNLANSKTALWAFARFTLKPRLKKIERVLNNTIVKEYGEDLYLEFDNPVPEDRVQIVDEYSKGVNQWLTPNDIRREEGLEELEGGDELNSASRNPFADLGAGKSKKKILDIERIHRGEKAWGEMIKSQSVHESKYKNALQDYFRGLNDKVLKKIQGKKGVKAVSELIDNEAEVAVLVDLLTPMQRELINQMGARALKKLGITTDFVITPSMEKVLSKYNIALSRSLNQTTVTALNTILIENEGAAIPELSSAINEYFDFADSTRAEQIARSETIRTSNQAMEDAWVQSEVVDAKEWYTALDERVCPYCEEMDGTIVGLGENYFDKGDELNGMVLDYRDIGEPPLHTSCRCVLLPVIK